VLGFEPTTYGYESECATDYTIEPQRLITGCEGPMCTPCAQKLMDVPLLPSHPILFLPFSCPPCPPLLYHLIPLLSPAFPSCPCPPIESGSPVGLPRWFLIFTLLWVSFSAFYNINGLLNTKFCRHNWSKIRRVALNSYCYKRDIDVQEKRSGM